jgi:hypothetical protein
LKTDNHISFVNKSAPAMDESTDRENIEDNPEVT